MDLNRHRSTQQRRVPRAPSQDSVPIMNPDSFDRYPESVQRIRAPQTATRKGSPQTDAEFYEDCPTGLRAMRAPQAATQNLLPQLDPNSFNRFPGSMKQSRGTQAANQRDMSETDALAAQNEISNFGSNSLSRLAQPSSHRHIEERIESVRARTSTNDFIPKQSSQPNNFQTTLQVNGESGNGKRVLYPQGDYSPSHGSSEALGSREQRKYADTIPYGQHSTHLSSLNKDLSELAPPTNSVKQFADDLTSVRELHLSGCLCRFSSGENAKNPYGYMKQFIYGGFRTNQLVGRMVGFLKMVETVKVMVSYHTNDFSRSKTYRDKERDQQRKWEPEVKQCLDNLFQGLRDGDKERFIPSVQVKVFYVEDETECGLEWLHVTEDHFR